MARINGVIGFYLPADLNLVAKSPDTPVEEPPNKPDPVARYGVPRTLVCENFNIHKLFAGTGIGCLLEVFNENPDSFVRRGVI